MMVIPCALVQPPSAYCKLTHSDEDRQQNKEKKWEKIPIAGIINSEDAITSPKAR